MIWCDTLGFCFEGEANTVTQGIVSYGLYIFRGDKIALIQPGVGPGAGIQGDGSSRADAVFYPAGQIITVGQGLASGHRELNDVFLNSRNHVYRQGLFTGCEYVLLAELLGWLAGGA